VQSFVRSNSWHSVALYQYITVSQQLNRLQTHTDRQTHRQTHLHTTTHTHPNRQTHRQTACNGVKCVLTNECCLLTSYCSVHSTRVIAVNYNISDWTNWTKLVRHCQIQCNFRGIDDLCKLCKKYLNCTDMQITHMILDKILKLLAYYTPFYH